MRQQQATPTNVTSPTWHAVTLGGTQALLKFPDKLKQALFNHAPRIMSLAEAQREFGKSNNNDCFFAKSPLASNEPHCPYGSKGTKKCKRDPPAH